MSTYPLQQRYYELVAEKIPDISPSLFIRDQTFLAEVYPYISIEFVRAMWPYVIKIVDEYHCSFDDIVATYCSC